MSKPLPHPALNPPSHDVSMGVIIQIDSVSTPQDHALPCSNGHQWCGMVQLTCGIYLIIDDLVLCPMSAQKLISIVRTQGVAALC